MKLRIAPAASRDIEGILEYVAAHSPAGASKLLGRLRHRFELLATQPFSAPSRDDIASGLRCLVVEQYCCFYGVDQQEVTIIRVLHGKRDLTDESFEA